MFIYSGWPDVDVYQPHIIITILLHGVNIGNSSGLQNFFLSFFVLLTSSYSVHSVTLAECVA